MEEIEVAEGCEGEGQTIGDVRGGAIIVGVRAPDGTFQPQPPAETVLERRATSSMAMGTARTMERLEALFEPAAARRGRVTPVERPARRRAGGGRRAGRRRRRRSRADARAPAAGRASATTRPTPRCCSRRALGRAAARGRRAARRRRCSERLGDALERFEVAGPGLPQPVPGRRLVRARARRRARAPATASARGGADAPRARPRRVRLGQPDRPDARRPRAATPPTATRSRGCSRSTATRVDARVLRQRRRLAGAQARRVDPGARARGEEVARGRLPGRLRRASSRPSIAGRRRRATRPSSARAAVELMVAQIQRDARTPSGVELRPLVLREHAARGRPEPGRARARARSSEHGHTVPRRGRAVAAHDRRSATTRTACCVRSSGEHTYFASDIAYHQDKRERGFDRLIDVLGRRPPRLRRAHEGGLRRRSAATPTQLELLIMQLVHLVRARRARADVQARAASSSRSTSSSREIGVDAARWFLLARSHDTTVDLDLDLAREQSSENPVYYVQYAHARIASMLAQGGRGARRARRWRDAPAERGEPLHPSERALIKQLLALPRRGRRGGRAPRAAPDRRLRARAGAGLHRLLPRLPRGRRRARGARVACGSRCASRRSARSRAALDLLGVSAPDEM